MIRSILILPIITKQYSTKKVHYQVNIIAIICQLAIHDANILIDKAGEIVQACHGFIGCGVQHSRNQCKSESEWGRNRKTESDCDPDSDAEKEIPAKITRT